MTPPGATVGNEPLSACCRGRTLKDSVWYSGWLLTFLATGEDTEGRFALIDALTRKGNVPPPHIHHREDETFYILEGEMSATIASQTVRGTAGTMIFAPRGVVHSIEIHSEHLRALILLTPAGLEGYFRECSVPAPAMTLPPPAEVPYSEIDKLIAVASRYGIEGAAPRP